MTRYLLDTNILSEAIRPRPSPRVVAWLDDQVDADLYISVMTVAEIERGILLMPTGRRRAELEAWHASHEGPRRLFAGRILAFDEHAALVWARLMVEGRRSGRPRNSLDMIIAATCETAGCILVTVNETDFTGLDFINPLSESCANPPAVFK